MRSLQIDRGALNFGLHFLRLVRDRLLVAACGQAQIGGKCRTLGTTCQQTSDSFARAIDAMQKRSLADVPGLTIVIAWPLAAGAGHHAKQRASG